MLSTEYLQRARQEFNKAIELDTSKDYDKACRQYEKSSELFQLALKWEKNRQIQQLARQSAAETLERAEKLKSHSAQVNGGRTAPPMLGVIREEQNELQVGMILSNNDILRSAMKRVIEANDLDMSGEYERAYRQYHRSLQLFELALKWECDPAAEDMIRKEAEGYLTRAEQLKDHLDGFDPHWKFAKALEMEHEQPKQQMHFSSRLVQLGRSRRDILKSRGSSRASMFIKALQSHKHVAGHPVHPCRRITYAAPLTKHSEGSFECFTARMLSFHHDNVHTLQRRLGVGDNRTCPVV